MRLPDGDPAPRDGALPASALTTLGERPLAVYIHIPFCAARCGYCDFNTYVPGEDGGERDLRAQYVDATLRELALARRVLGAGARSASSIFVGGGTPTLLEPDQLARILDAVADQLGIEAGAEITTEANPESVDPVRLRALRRAGFTRISLGMQSAVPHVLATLDRRHGRGRPVAAAREAIEAGFDAVSLDLIYGAPGERDEDWAQSLRSALAAGVDHISAYGLTVEPGTRLAARVHRGELPMPDDDAMAGRYRIADEQLSGAGLRWYEISNWARDERSRSRHNLAYWRSHDWWGVGAGAHSHVGGVRWWNVLHPRRYVDLLGEGASPGAGRELLTDEQRRTERIMLELRLVEGLPLNALDARAQPALDRERAAGRVVVRDDRAVLTLDGRLMADAVARALTP